MNNRGSECARRGRRNREDEGGFEHAEWEVPVRTENRTRTEAEIGERRCWGTEPKGGSLPRLSSWDSGMSASKGKETDRYLPAHTEIHSKGIIDLNVRVKTIKLREENRSKSL